jgi:ATP-binding cassette subfamily C protein CydD
MAKERSWLDQRGRLTRRHLAFTVVLGELSGIALIAQTALLVAIVDGTVMRGSGIRELLPFFAAIVGVIALRALLTWGVRRAAFECASIVKRSVRRELIVGLETIAPVALARMHTGEIAEVVVDAVESLEGYYAGYLPQRAIATLLPFTVLAVVFPLDWISGLVLVLTAVFLPLSMIVIGEEAHERNQRLWATLARISGRFLDSLRGLATIKMFDASRRETAEIERSSDEYRLATMSVLRIAFLSSFMLEFITAVSIAIVAVLTGLRLLSGHMHFAPGYFILLIAPDYFLTLRTLGTQYHARMEAASAAEQIRKLLGKMTKRDADAPVAVSTSVPAVWPGAEAGVPPTRGSALEFRDVNFGYPGRPVLEGLTFSLSAGERLALVGPSGCGKSTILNLILGFSVPLRGSITLDDRDIGLVARDELYESVAWLPQRPTLFHGSIRYNIGLGRPGASDDDIESAARAAYVDEFSESLPSGLDCLVGEGGRSLSSGQAQRVALARLFLRSPRLILLDEPTAHLDPRSEEYVNAAISVLAEGRSMIVVTHRPVAAAMRSFPLRAVP